MAGAAVFTAAVVLLLVVGTYLLQAAIRGAVVAIRLGALWIVAVLMLAGHAAAAVSAALPRRAAGLLPA